MLATHQYITEPTRLHVMGICPMENLIVINTSCDIYDIPATKCVINAKYVIFFIIDQLFACS